MDKGKAAMKTIDKGRAPRFLMEYDARQDIQNKLRVIKNRKQEIKDAYYSILKIELKNDIRERRSKKQIMIDIADYSGYSLRGIYNFLNVKGD